MTLDFSVKTIIEQKITEIEEEYQRTQGLILTEDDLKCLLYSKLMQISELSQPRETQDRQIRANSIHTEVSWSDANGRYTIRPDITILEPECLSILHGKGSKLPLPSKQFEAHGKAIVFELKFIRYKSGITLKVFDGKKSSIMKDYRKIQRLFDILDSQGKPNDMFCYFIIFNKTNKKCGEFDRFIERNGESIRHKIIYVTGNVRFG